MKKLFHALGLAIFALTQPLAAESGVGGVSYPGGKGLGAGKHVVLLAGDEEYRSEEALPMLAKILSQTHGFKCTVLFSVDPDGTINPNRGESLGKPEALDSADAIVTSLRFRKWSDAAMKHFDDAIQRGVPVVGMRTSTHAFDLPRSSAFVRYNDFGKKVLGEEWVSHWGNHKEEATRGVIEPAAAKDSLLRGVLDVFCDSDVYEAYPPADAVVLVRGQVLMGMDPKDPPSARENQRATDKQKQAVNAPMMPVAWRREVANVSGKSNRVLCTTMGAATDLTSEGLRRLLVNGVIWGLGLEVPVMTDVTLVGEYHPSHYEFDGFKRGVKASDHDLGR